MSSFRAIGAAGTLALACSLTALGCEVTGRAGSAPGVPVSGAVLVYEGRRYQSFRADTPNAANIHVSDVHHDAQGWLVSVATVFLSVPTYHSSGASCSSCIGGSTRNPIGGSASAGVYFPTVQSADGVTYRPMPIAGTGPSGYFLGLHRGGGRTTAVSTWVHETARTEGRFYNLNPVDEAAATFSVDPAVSGMQLQGNPYAHGAVLSGVRTDEGLAYVNAVLYDGALTHWEENLSEFLQSYPRATDEYEWVGQDQEHFYTLVSTRDGRERCLAHVAIHGSHTPDTRCTPRLDWPAFLEPGGRSAMHRASVGVVVIGAKDGRAGAAMMDPTTNAVRRWDLGPAGVPVGITPSIHQRFGRFYAFNAGDGSRRFVDVQADGRAVQAIFAPTPCTDHAACPSTIEWIEPLGDGEYNVFYVSEPDPTAAIHEYVYSLRQRPRLIDADSYVPASDAGADADAMDATATSPVPAFPSARAAGGLERACTAMELCNPLVSRDRCLLEWGAIPPTAPSYARFVAAATMGCGAVLDAWQAPAHWRSACRASECRGDVLVARCSGSEAEVVVDCALYGTHCAVERGLGRCTDGSPSLQCDTCSDNGSAVYCGSASAGLPVALDCRAAGLECDSTGPNPQCLPARTGCAESEARCNGARLEWCMGGRPYSYDCTAEGRGCGTDEQAHPVCDNPGHETTCLGSGIQPQCAGEYLVFCTGANAFAEAHYVDCRTLGGHCNNRRCE